MESSTSSKPTTPASKKTPILTWQSFLISFGIILVLFLVISSLTGGNKDQKETMVSKTGETYEYTVLDGDEFSSNSVLVIPVNGVILTEGAGDAGFFDFLSEGGVTYGYDVKEKLKRAAENKDVKAVLLEINSPGGTIGGSKAIADGIEYYRQATGNPVYSHITDVGASGAYWAAATTDMIVAEAGATIGSIGVILGPFSYYDDIIAEGGILGGVETEGGITYRYFSAGQFKDTGSPYRQLTPDEERHWQTAVNNEYELFVDHVSAYRNLSREQIVNDIKALPYENKRALELGLIDASASRDETIEDLAAAAGLEPEDYNVIREDLFVDFFTELFGQVRSLTPHSTAQSKACTWCNQPLMLYDSSYSLFQ